MKTIWELPVPESALRGLSFRDAGGRDFRISALMEMEDRQVDVVLGGLEAYRRTYRGGVTAEMIDQGYERLVDIGETTWLGEIRTRVAAYNTARRGPVVPLRHLLFYRDGGPCDEFICASVSITEGPRVEADWKPPRAPPYPAGPL